MSTLCILGRQPAIGAAELESLYGSEKLRRVGSAVWIDDDPSNIDPNRLGGTIKVCKILEVLNDTSWAGLTKHLKNNTTRYIANVPEGKLQLGLSVHDMIVHLKKVQSFGLELKKSIRSTGRSVRLVPNKSLALNTAQTLHNNLTGKTGFELVCLQDGPNIILAQTVWAQNIEAYSNRDQTRPMRDARIGMLPPKLAQIIINLAVGPLHFPQLSNHRPAVLDPFCGTGVLLQEALLMDYEARGSDLNQEMVESATKNLEWLCKRFKLKSPAWRVIMADATRIDINGVQFISSETYLGRPFSSRPKPEILVQVVQDVDTIHKKFLRNVTRQTKPGFRMCLAIPAWKTKYGFKRLPMLDHLTDMGYNRVSFVHAKEADMIYHRPGQFVGRELLVLVRI